MSRQTDGDDDPDANGCQTQTGATSRRRETRWQGGGNDADKAKGGGDCKEAGANGHHGEDDLETNGRQGTAR